MDSDAVRAFANRDWEAIAGSKREHWTRVLRTAGPAALFRVAQHLREHTRMVRPDWPSPNDRARDLANHIALKQLLDRASHAGSRS